MSISFAKYASKAGGGTGAGGFIPTVSASSGPADEALLNELYAGWMARAVLQFLEQKWLAVPAPIRTDVEQEYARPSSDKDTNRVAESERMRLGWLKLFPTEGVMTSPEFWDSCRIVVSDVQLWERYLQSVHRADLLVEQWAAPVRKVAPEYQRMITLSTELYDTTAAAELTATAEELQQARAAAGDASSMESARHEAMLVDGDGATAAASQDFRQGQ